MPVPEDIQQRLREHAEAKRRGEQPTFGNAREPHMPDWSSPELAQQRRSSGEEAAQRMVDLEAMFGQQAAALDANLRAMMMTLRQLQQTRMEVFGRGPSAAERDLARQAQTFGMSTGADGFLQRNAPDSGTTPSPSTNDGGSNGNVSR
jgi:hypothetical protein